MPLSPVPDTDELQSGRALGLVIGAVGPAAAAGLGLLLRPLLAPNVEPLFLLAIAAAALVGGLDAGLLGVVLSAVAVHYWFYPPFGGFGFQSQADLVRQLVFWACALVIVALSARSRAQRLAAEARASQRERRRAAAERRAADRAAEAEVRAHRAAARPPGTALVADPDPEARQLACHALDSAGWRWLSACDGVEAVELLDRYDIPLELAVIEAVLPDMAGREVAERVAARHPGAVVLFTSASPQEDLVLQGWLRPEQPFLRKPFSADDLVRTARELVATAVRA